MEKVIGFDEISIFSPKHDVYQLIDPTPLFESKAYKGFVVLVTGGGRGIGAAIASAYAFAGADLVITGRNKATLDAFATSTAKNIPGARVEVVIGDISDPEVSKKAVQAAVNAFGKLDIVIPNAAVSTVDRNLLAGKDSLQWWYTQEVNVRGTFGVIHSAIPELLKTNGQIVVITSDASHLRIPTVTDYGISKHTLNRLTELVAIEYPDIKAYAVHPGGIATDGAKEFVTKLNIPAELLKDTVELPAATILWLTRRNAEFLSGRYIQATWDLGEVLALKDEIIRDNLLVTKLAGPRKAT